MPSVPPMARPIPIALKPTIIETRAPYTMRDSMSLPRSSSPSRWCRVGPWDGGPRSVLLGLGSGSTAARIAPSTTTMIQPDETQNTGPNRRLTVSSGSGGCASSTATGRPSRTSGATGSSDGAGMADPGVEEGVDEVDDEVDDDVAGSDDEHRALHDEVVAGEDRLHGEAAHTPEPEDHLDDERAADEAAELQPGHRHQR